ncbi:MAG: PAS domain S-box protein, partial [Acetobacteraceae bacterium]
MAALIRAKDWSATPLGPIEAWSPALRMMVTFLLANRFPLLLWWGPDYISIYNDAYRPVLGTKHPWALGRPVRECWSEIWDVLKPLVDTPFNAGPATWMEDIQLEINRYGFFEETHFTIAYSPVPDDTAPRGIGGVLAMAHEITEVVVSERRIGALRDLGAHSGGAGSEEEAGAAAMSALAGYPKDVPFALLYLFDAAGEHARLAGAAGAEPGDPVAPAAIAIDPAAEAEEPWPVSELIRRESMVTVENLAERFTELPPGPWSDPPHTAVVAPIESNVPHRLAGFLVAGVSPRLPLDDRCRGFLDLVARRIAATVAAARAYEKERERAEALAEMNQAKTRFFANVSHEFRTPLTLMLGPLEAALTAPGLPAAERERLGVAHRNSLRLLKLVNSLLDFSRIEAGRARASYEPTDLAAFTTDLAGNFRSACERAGLALAVDCPPLAEPVYVDRDQWEKIVLNLLSNAFKFTFEGGITVALRAADGQAELTVADTGVGIAADEVPHLFERFHRIEGQRSRTYEGSGIGLALVQELVKLHGGEIAVHSEADRGTTFTVRIPFGTAHLPEERLGAPSGPAPTYRHAEALVGEALRWLADEEDGSEARGEAAGSGGEKSPLALNFPQASDAPLPRVLVADDNADMRAYLRTLLAPYCELQTVADGQAALEAIHERRPDLVLADVMMPRLDGFGLLRAIREDPEFRELQVIVLSARAGEESRVEGLEAGADDYIVKPFSARDFLARVRNNLMLAHIRTQASRELRESEDRHRRLVEQTPDGIFVTDGEGRYVDVNQAGCKMLGMTREEVLASTLADVLAPEEHHRIAAEFARFDNGRIVRGEWRMRRKDGATFDTEIVGRRLPNGTLQGIVRDVTERRRIERTANRLAAIVEFSDDAMIRKNLDGIIQTWNAGAERMFGYTAEEAIGRPVTILMPPERKDEEPGILARIRRGERVDRYETVRQRKDGSLLDISLSVSPIRDAEGRVVAASKVARDITWRKRAEAVLRESEERKAFLLKLSDALQPLRDPLNVQHEVARLLGEYLGASRAFYFGVEREQDDYVHVIERDFFATSVMASLTGRYPQSAYGKNLVADLERGEPLVVADIGSLPHLTAEQR